jgi:hypothetical protein
MWPCWEVADFRKDAGKFTSACSRLLYLTCIYRMQQQKSSDGRSIKVVHVDVSTALSQSGVVEENSCLQIATQLRIQIARDLLLPLADVIDSRTDHIYCHVLCSGKSAFQHWS